MSKVRSFPPSVHTYRRLLCGRGYFARMSHLTQAVLGAVCDAAALQLESQEGSVPLARVHRLSAVVKVRELAPLYGLTTDEFLAGVATLEQLGLVEQIAGTIDGHGLSLLLTMPSDLGQEVAADE